MNMQDKVRLVQRMQDYLLLNSKEDNFCFDEFYSFIGYSKRHADRLFKELLGRTPQEYFKLIRLTDSAKRLAANEDSILNVAIDTEFNTHEGYTKAFRSAFGTLPSEYKKGKSFIPMFVSYPITSYYEQMENKEEAMEGKTCLCMITPVKKENRKLIFLPSKKAHDYWTYCEELGCDWEGLLNSMPCKFGPVAVVTLPPFLIKEGYGKIAAGIEVPYDYDGEIPGGCEIAELKAGVMLSFESQPFETEEEFFVLNNELFKAVDTFDYEGYGYTVADELAPRFNYGGQGGKAKLMIPVSKI